MGRNGAGKSTLLGQPGRPAHPGHRQCAARRRSTPADATPAEIVRRAGLVPQDPRSSCTPSRWPRSAPARDTGLRPPVGHHRGRARPDRARARPATSTRATSPRDSGSPWPLAVVLASDRLLVLLDEPTRGLDYAAKHRLVAMLRELAAAGHAVVLATHDVELAAEVATRVVVLAEGEVVADGPAGDVLAGSPAFAPQVAKVLHPVRLLTVDEVVEVAGAGVVTPHRWRTPVVMALVLVVGVVAFTWPFLAAPGSEIAQRGHGGDASVFFVVLMVLMAAVLLAELSSGGIDAKTIAVLGVLAAAGGCPAGAVGRDRRARADVLPDGAGRAGAWARARGFMLGALAMLASAFLTAGVGPWTPFQMIACGWVCLGAALLPEVRGPGERWLLAAYGFVAGLAYGALMNLWFWPFLGDSAPAAAGYVPDGGAGRPTSATTPSSTSPPRSPGTCRGALLDRAAHLPGLPPAASEPCAAACAGPASRPRSRSSTWHPMSPHAGHRRRPQREEPAAAESCWPPAAR